MGAARCQTCRRVRRGGPLAVNNLLDATLSKGPTLPKTWPILFALGPKIIYIFLLSLRQEPKKKTVNCSFLARFPSLPTRDQPKPNPRFWLGINNFGRPHPFSTSNSAEFEIREFEEGSKEFLLGFAVLGLCENIASLFLCPISQRCLRCNQPCSLYLNHSNG